MKALQTQIAGQHYKKYKIQPIEFIYANQIPYIEARCIEYLLRWQDKNGIEDLRKVQHYIDMLIELHENSQKQNITYPLA